MLFPFTSFLLFSFHVVLFFMAVIHVVHPLSLLTFDSGLDYWFNFQSNGKFAVPYHFDFITDTAEVVQPIQ